MKEQMKQADVRELTAKESATVNGGDAYSAGRSFGSWVINEPTVRFFQLFTDAYYGV